MSLVNKNVTSKKIESNKSQNEPYSDAIDEIILALF